MKVYNSFRQCWMDLGLDSLNGSGFSDWQVVKISHTSNRKYSDQKKNGIDDLGFQPLSFRLANPFTYKTQDILIKDVDDKVANDFRNFCRLQYKKHFINRFNSFKPDVFSGFTEYEDWESFYSNWLERDGKSVFRHNIPLMFDHTSKTEYFARKQTGQKVMPYQRMLVTTYFVSENKFFDFFIKEIDDVEFADIKNKMKTVIDKNIDTLFTARESKAHVG